MSDEPKVFDAMRCNRDLLKNRPGRDAAAGGRGWAVRAGRRCVGAIAGAVLALAAGPHAVAANAAPADRATVIVVVGAPGEPEFGADFAEDVKAWHDVTARAEAKLVTVGESPATAGEPADRERLQQALSAEPKDGVGELWLVLLGHGTFDGKEAKLNLRGPDFSASELAEWLKPFQRPVAVIDTASSSAPFLLKLAAKNRVVVTSTRSGYEQNYARFGKYFAKAMGDAASDLDKDGQVSLLEAFLRAAHDTAEFYKADGRLATEHPLLDDNGDGLGTPADWFQGVRAVRKAQDNAPLDGARAQQFVLVRSAAEQQLAPEVRARRDKLELQLAELRDGKAKLPDDEYYERLEKVLLELAALYEGT